MSADSPPRPGPRGRIAVGIVAVGLAVRFVPGWLAPLSPTHLLAVSFSALATLLALLIWWMAVRSVSRRERSAGLAIVVGLIATTFLLSHSSMPWVLVPLGLPAMLGITAAAIAITEPLPWNRRRWILVSAIAASLLPWIAVRHDGQSGDLRPRLVLRGSPTAEDRFLASRTGLTPAAKHPVTLAADSPSDWPGFRGPRRDAVVRGLTFDADWSAHPPVELWRRAVGPGWSSFAVAGPLVFTQEQRGDREAVVAYALEDGREVWVQSTLQRFEEPAAGPGPRATPTFDRGALFTLGARGTLQRLDAATGELRWRRDLREDPGGPIPDWGFCSSPAIVGDAVVVFAGAPDGRSVAAFDRETGQTLWANGHGTLGYGSGHVAALDDSPVVLMASDYGLQGFRPETGALVLDHAWPAPMARVVQPVVLEGGSSLVLGTGYGVGTRRLALDRVAPHRWKAREIWTRRSLKPYFNDMVCHEGHCYGFDGKVFTSIGLDDGERRWKGGRYGNGQLLLFADMDLLLVLTEAGELVLVDATPEAHRERARVRALTGKTWNHLALTGDRLLVRNGEEAVCYRLPRASRDPFRSSQPRAGLRQ